MQSDDYDYEKIIKGILFGGDNPNLVTASVEHNAAMSLLGGGGPVKGVKYLAKMAKTYPGAVQKIELIGTKFWKYTTQVAGKNGMTIHTKILNMNGKTMKYFHDTYNSANKFMHRGWTEGSIKVHQWWNGVKQYGQHFFQNR